MTDRQVYSASADKTAAMWDVETSTRLRRFREHTSFVNSIVGSRKGDPLIVTGSDDCKALVFDTRSKHSIQTLETEFQVSTNEWLAVIDCVVVLTLSVVVRCRFYRSRFLMTHRACLLLVSITTSKYVLWLVVVVVVVVACV